MPSNIVKDFASKTGKSEKEVEKLWDRAKELTSEELGVAISNFSDREYKYTVGVLKNMLGIKEKKKIKEASYLDFLNSGMSSDEYIENMISTNFSIGQDGGLSRKPDDELEEEDEFMSDDPMIASEPIDMFVSDTDIMEYDNDMYYEKAKKNEAEDEKDSEKDDKESGDKDSKDDSEKKDDKTDDTKDSEETDDKETKDKEEEKKK